MPTSFPMSLPRATPGFQNQTSLDTAYATPINDLYALFAAGPQGLLGEANSSTTTTIAATGGSYVPASASYTFTLASTRRVRIAVTCDFQIASAAARFLLRPAYNSGGTPGTAIPIGIGASVYVSAAGSSGINGGANEFSVLLTAGTYTAYAGVFKSSGGAATDAAVSNRVSVYDEGAN